MGIKELLTNQLKEMSVRELARKCNVSHSTISDILHDKRTVSREFCLALANGLGLEYSYVLQLAGYNSDEASAQAARDLQIARELRGLNNQQVEMIRQFTKMLREQNVYDHEVEALHSFIKVMREQRRSYEADKKK